MSLFSSGSGSASGYTWRVGSVFDSGLGVLVTIGFPDIKTGVDPAFGLARPIPMGDPEAICPPVYPSEVGVGRSKVSSSLTLGVPEAICPPL
jgi:hypothetical protein